MPNCDIPELKPFLNEKGQLTALPVKRKKKLLALYYLSQKMETGRQYTEGEINDLLNNWTTFRDPATLRRALYDTCLLERTGLPPCGNDPATGGICGKIHLIPEEQALIRPKME